MTDEVGELVLTDNYRQNQAISLMERMSVSRLGSKQHFIRTLESQGLLDRQIEFLPSDAELAERKARGQGLTRPELSVLLSYSQDRAVPAAARSDVPEDPYLSKELVRYFPQPLQEKYAKAHGEPPPEARDHRHRGDQLDGQPHGRDLHAAHAGRHRPQRRREIAKAYTITREALDARELWAQIDALDGKVPEAAQIDALQVIWHLQRTMTRWLLSRPGEMPDIATAVARYQRRPQGRARAVPGRCSPDAQRPGLRGQPARVEGQGRAGRHWAAQLAALPLPGVRLRHHRGRAANASSAGRTWPRRYFAPRRGAAPAVADGADRGACRSTAAGMRWPAACCATSWARSSARWSSQVLADAGAQAADAKVEALAAARRRHAALHAGHARRPAQPEDAGLPDGVGGGARLVAARLRAAERRQSTLPARPAAGNGRRTRAAFFVHPTDVRLARLAARCRSCTPRQLTGSRVILQPAIATEPPMTATPRIAFLASPADEAQRALAELVARHGDHAPRRRGRAGRAGRRRLHAADPAPPRRAWAGRCTA